MAADRDVVRLISTEKFLDWIYKKCEVSAMSRRELLRRSKLSHNMLARRAGDMKLSTVAALGDALGYDLTLTKRDK